MTSLLLFDTPTQLRRRYVNNVADAVGRSNVRAFYLPSPTEGLTAVDQMVASRVWTHGATPTGRLSKLGNGTALSFNGTSDYITAPDAADLSFGNGSVDTPWSVFAMCNVTDSAAARMILSKYNTANFEYNFQITAADLPQALVQNGAAFAFRPADAAPAQGVWQSYGSSYNQSPGGATAANGITLYVNGAVIASTANNTAAGAYVAMSDLGAALEVGSSTAHTANFFLGSMAMVLLVGALLTTAQYAQLTQLSRSFYGVPA